MLNISNSSKVNFTKKVNPKRFYLSLIRTLKNRYLYNIGSKKPNTFK
jgi:hypothetical protein